MSWRDSIDKTIKQHLEVQIKESIKQKEAINKSKSPSNAQLWVAIANLSRQIFELEMKSKYLEAALRDSLQKKIETTSKKVTTNKKTTKKKSKKRKK